MKNTLLNISGKMDKKAVDLYKSMLDATAKLDIPLMVIGASARDMVLHYGHHARIQRATEDIDFGIQVHSWAAFESLKRSLLEKGFTETKANQRLISPEGIKVDIVPFGKIEDEQLNIVWPPDGDWVMSVMGFQEAYDNAETVRVQDKPVVDIPVVTPSGMALLKLIAWTDRSADMRRKDAKDLGYLFTTYEKIPAINALLYEDQKLMIQYDWDIQLASTHQLGMDAKAIARMPTINVITALFLGRHDKLSVELLMEEMCEHIESEFDRNEKLTRAFMAGFLSVG